MVKRYTVTLSDDQAKILDALAIGSTGADKIHWIVIKYFENNNFIIDSAKKKLGIKTN